MFESIKKVVMICLKGTLDLMLGASVAAVMNNVFPFKDTNNHDLFRSCLEIFVQSSLTLLIGLEARSLFFNEEDTMTEPYGITFMMSLYNQPGFWKKINALEGEIVEMIFPISSPPQ